MADLLKNSPGNNPLPMRNLPKRQEIHTPWYLAVFAVVMWIIGSVLLSSAAPALVLRHPAITPELLASTHAIALGFATSFIIVVLYQFVLAHYHAKFGGSRERFVVGIGYPISVLLFVTAFEADSAVLAALGGTCAAISLGMVLFRGMRAVIPAMTRSAAAALHVLAFISLSGIVILGPLLALDRVISLHIPVGEILGMKLILAAGGWICGILIAVSYSTVRGLNRSTAHPRFQWAVFSIAAFGIVATECSIAFNAPRIIGTCAALCCTCAVVLYAVDMILFVMKRSPRAEALTWLG